MFHSTLPPPACDWLRSCQYYRSCAYSKTSQWDRAMADPDKAIQLNPQKASYCFVRAATNWEMGHLDSALADFTSAFRIASQTGIPIGFPEDVVYVYRGRVYAESGDRAKALADFDMALGINPQNTEAAKYRARCAPSEGKVESHESACPDTKKEKGFFRSLFSSFLYHKCPKCNEHSGKQADVESLKSYQEVQSCPNPDHDYRWEQMVMNCHVYRVIYQCDDCGYRWAVRKRDDTIA